MKIMQKTFAFMEKELMGVTALKKYYCETHSAFLAAEEIRKKYVFSKKPCYAFKCAMEVRAKLTRSTGVLMKAFQVSLISLGAVLGW